MAQNKKDKRISDWKEQADELNTQVSLKADRVEDEFEAQKASLKKWLTKWKEKAQGFKEIGDEKATELKTKMEELELQLILGKAETRDAVTEQQKKIAKNIQALKQSVKKNYESSEERLKVLSADAHEKLDHFHTRFDMMKLQAILGKKEAEDKWEEHKMVASKKIAEIKDKIEAGKELAEDKWDDFVQDVGSSFADLRNAFRDEK